MCASPSALPYDDRDGFIWMNGKMIPWRDAKTHVLTHGLHYGGSVFEGERVYDGQIFKLTEHSERLIFSGKCLDMDVPFSAKALNDASYEVIKANNITNGYVRPLAYRGAEQMGVSAKGTKVHVAIACWKWPKYFFPKAGDAAGLALRTASWRRPDPRTMPTQAKACGVYMIGTLAKHEAESNGYDDALMLDFRGRVAESSGANLFAIRDGVIYTPIADCFLNGITRQTVMKLARDMGYTVEETAIMPEEMKTFEEVFLTGTAAEIAPVSKIDTDITYTIGPVTTRLKDAYSDLVHQKAKAA
ncbi:branched-chain amino acid aminotransferase [Micavibrio aeruginosavorus]|uniref:branched-chain amino acid aminotransferase n=1 Tax=Micavibrio aeruginosavorus TaxID=349221 RepID=UPI003F4AB54F